VERLRPAQSSEGLRLKREGRERQDSKEGGGGGRRCGFGEERGFVYPGGGRKGVEISGKKRGRKKGRASVWEEEKKVEL